MIIKIDKIDTLIIFLKSQPDYLFFIGLYDYIEGVLYQRF